MASEHEPLAVISEELDLILQRICIEQRMSPLNLSAIVLARLVHLNNVFDSKDDLGKLMLSIGNSILNQELELNSGKLH